MSGGEKSPSLFSIKGGSGSSDPIDRTRTIGKFTNSEIMKLVPFIGKTSVENALKKLLREKAIERHGSGMSTFYTRSG